MRFWLLVLRELAFALQDPPEGHQHTPLPNGRCRDCTHRCGAGVIATRDLPPGKWFGEIKERALSALSQRVGLTGHAGHRHTGGARFLIRH